MMLNIIFTICISINISPFPKCQHSACQLFLTKLQLHPQCKYYFGKLPRSCGSGISTVLIYQYILVSAVLGKGLRNAHISLKNWWVMFLLLAWCHDSPDAQTFDLNNSVALASNRMNFVGQKPNRIGSLSLCTTIGHINNIPTM